MNKGPTRKLIPILVLAAFVAITVLITQTKPTADRYSKPPAPDITVEIQRIQPRPYQIQIESFGTVQPRTRSQLISQVSGQVIAIGPAFRDGGFFDKGDILISIDPRDYDIAIETAQAELTNAQALLAEQEAQAQQARTEWANARGKASDFALRKPQVAAAQATVASAKARLRQAQLNRERTQIKAPFSGRVLSKAVDIGQVVSSNTQLAEIYAVDIVEIRLPLKNSELSYIDLPEIGHQQQSTPNVAIRSNLGRTPATWRGKLVRTAGAIDENSNQLHVIAQIDDPYGLKNNGEKPGVAAASDKLPLKIGQYVSATIKGRLLENAIVIPNTAIYQGSYVYIVTAENILERRDITLAWQNAGDAIVATGLSTGEQLVMTPLGRVTSGTRVQTRPAEQQTAATEPARSSRTAADPRPPPATQRPAPRAQQERTP